MNNEHQATIVSLWSSGFFYNRSYGTYLIPPREKDGMRAIDPGFEKTYGMLEVRDASDGMDIGDKRRIPMLQAGRAIAEDLVNSNDIGKFGVFVAAGAVPTRAELAAAHLNLVKFYKFLIQDGDTKYSREQDRININDQHRLAVTELGEERIWVYSFDEVTRVQNLVKCPACRLELPDAAAIICAKCGAVLDVKAWEKFQPQKKAS